jgi:hypothetical protein
MEEDIRSIPIRSTKVLGFAIEGFTPHIVLTIPQNRGCFN